MTALGIQFHLYALLSSLFYRYIVYFMILKRINNTACNKGTLLIIPFPLNIWNSVIFHNQNIEVTNQNNSMLMKMTNQALKAVR